MNNILNISDTVLTYPINFMTSFVLQSYEIHNFIVRIKDKLWSIKHKTILAFAHHRKIDHFMIIPQHFCCTHNLKFQIMHEHVTF